MACKLCNHWAAIRKSGQSSASRYSANSGKCTFNPEWIETKPDHFCGRFALAMDDWNYQEPHLRPLLSNILSQRDEFLQQRNEAERSLREKNKENKEIRALYRKETGKVAKVKKPKQQPNA